MITNPAQIIITVVSSLTTIVLGYLVWQKDRRKYQNISFLLLTTALSLWTIFTLVHKATGSLFWGRAIFLPLPLIVFSLLVFSNHFPVSKTRFLPKKWQRILVIAAYFLMTIVGIGPLVLQDVQIIEGTLSPVSGPLLVPFYMVSFCFASIALWTLLRNYFRASKESRLKMQYLLVGLFLMILGMILFALILPAIFDSYEIAFYAPVFSIVLVAFVALSIVRRRLWSMQYLVGEAVYYLFLSVVSISVLEVFLVVYNGFFSEVHFVVRVFLEIVIAGFSLPLFIRLNRWAKSILEHGVLFKKTSPHSLSEEVNAMTSKELDLLPLSRKFMGLMQRALRLKYVYIYLWKPKDKSFYFKGTSLSKDKTAYLNYEEVVLLEKSFNKGETFFNITDLLKKKSSLESRMEVPLEGLIKRLFDRDIAIAMQLDLQQDMRGVLIIGEKEDGKILAQEDYDLLENSVYSFNVALDRALLYERVSKFNKQLQEEIQKATSELEEANKELRELDKAKDDLISIASHELRTPATIVKGKLHLLKGRIEKLKVCEGYDPRIERDIDVCLSAIEREIEQVNTLLEASRIGKETMVLDKQLYDLYEIAKQSVNDFKEIAGDKGLSLSLKPASREFPFVNMDVRRIREVVDNLITNAIKYTDEGSITLRVFQNNARRVCLSITDTGVGIPEEKREKLFTKFYRVRNEREERSQLVKPGGTGLGLYVAKNIVEKHDGKIAVESEVAKGSTFTFCLPVGDKRTHRS